MEDYKLLKDFEAQREKIESLAVSLFRFMLSCPNEERKDEKERTGMKILIRQKGTANISVFDIAEPSGRTCFFVTEKILRMENLKHRSSQESQNEEKLYFSGALCYADVQISVSGLQAHEDAAVAFVVLSKLFNLNFDQMKGNFPKGSLPEGFNDPNSYLSRMLLSF
jgi:hypothetical protein